MLPKQWERAVNCGLGKELDPQGIQKQGGIRKNTRDGEEQETNGDQ